VAGVYIHIPFCKQACYYCDFHFSTSTKRKTALLEALNKELILRKNELKNQIIETIYFGGGTPSLLSVHEIEELLSTIYKNYKVVSKPEITLEANPDDLSEEKISALASTKINRLSIGIQSFFEDDLKFMNRAHTAQEAINCLTIAKKYFKNITIDLIYGVPKMTNIKWRKNLQIAFDLDIPHISSYALTVEEKTALHAFIKKGKIKPLDEQLALKHFNILVEETEKNGFIQYEISNFGKPTFFSKHNTSYWLGINYIGIGPSSHSYNGLERAWNISNNATYINAITNNQLPLQLETLTGNDRFNEYIMTGLRTIWGVSFEKIEKDFGALRLELFKKNVTSFINNGLLELNYSSFSCPVITTTKKGRFLVDGIASNLFLV
jgi:oxygen-independent coproporphyrinogen-3 oxidase